MLIVFTFLNIEVIANVEILPKDNENPKRASL